MGEESPGQRPERAGMVFSFIIHHPTVFTEFDADEQVSRVVSFQRLAGELGDRLKVAAMLRPEGYRLEGGVSSKVADDGPLPVRALALVECDSLDDAEELAGRLRAAQEGRIEVGPALLLGR